MKPPRVIFFDFGDTLVETEPSYIERLRMSFVADGVEVTYDDMERAFVEADWRSALAIMDRKPFREDAWRELYIAVMLDTLQVPDKSKSTLRQISDRMATIIPVRRVMPGVVEFLEACAETGIRMAILSNNDGSMKHKAVKTGIADYFEMFVDSTIEKTAKPDPDFFTRSMRRMDVVPGECLHVGDLLGCDVAGAQAAGIPAVWFNQRKYRPDSPIEPEIEVGDYSALAKLLEIRL